MPIVSEGKIVTKPSTRISDCAEIILTSYIGHRCKILIDGSRPIIAKIISVETRCQYEDTLDLYELRMRMTTDHHKPVVVLTVSFEPNQMELVRDELAFIVTKVASAIEANIKVLDETPLSRTLYER